MHHLSVVLIATQYNTKKEVFKLMQLIKNIIQCKSCEDIIESTHRHDFKWCQCGKVAIDGGLDYGKRIYPEPPSEDWIEDLSEYKN
jgi:hypothetical protein